MKRWQDRGEVEDSDEENSSLSINSQSPEHARKRPRLNVGVDEDIEAGDPSDNALGTTAKAIAQDVIADGPRPGVATPSINKTTARSARSGQNDTPNGAAASSKDYGSTLEDAEESWINAKDPTLRTAITYARQATRETRSKVVQRESPAVAQSQRREATCVAIPSRLVPPNEEGLVVSQSDVSSGSETELPNMSQLLARRIVTRPQTPAGAGLAGTSAASSPSSELIGSPQPPDIFTFGDWEDIQSTAVAHIPPSTALRANADAAGDDAEIIAQIREADQAAVLAVGRTFRARQEKQLHPYAWDKTLYQQQWKQRGLKPIHVDTADRRAPETQDRAYSGDESDGQEQVAPCSDPPSRPSSELGGDATDYGLPNAAANATVDRDDSQPAASDDDFPDIEAVLRRNLHGVAHHGRKRRKVTHVQGDVWSTEAATFGVEMPDIDEYSVPPSPPPTSSDTARQNDLPSAPLGFRTLPSGFRVPVSRTPAPLPTPLGSSDRRPSYRASRYASLDSESPPTRSALSAITRSRLKPITIESGTESEAEGAEGPSPEVDVEDKRLRRVQKRIRGVLPASWLKIDLQSRQRQVSPSPSRPRRLSSTSPRPIAGPQKGVAQRVTRPTATPGRKVPILLSDDGDGSEHERATPAVRPLLGAGLRLGRTDLSRDDADDDRMEMDSIDPMLTSTSRAPRRPRETKQRQPRIADAFRKASSRGVDLSEERLMLQHRAGVTRNDRGTAAKSRKSAPQVRSTRPPAPRLSVLDAPRHASNVAHPVPQFLRVAQRQVRKRADRGRHLPSGKVVRLATREDTEDATDVLTAWREGIILPRASPDEPGVDQTIDLTVAESDGEGFGPGALGTSSVHSRLILAEITNLQQQQLPVLSRKEPDARAAHRQYPAADRRPRVRQTQLQPIHLHYAADSTAAESVSAESAIIATLSAGEGLRLRPQQSRRQLQPQNVWYRGAQLESLENAYDQEHRAAAFDRRMAYLTAALTRPSYGGSGQSLLMDRFLNQEQIVQTTQRPVAQRQLPTARTQLPATHDGIRALGPSINKNPPARPFALARRPRKRKPHHIDVGARQYRQPSEPLPDATIVDEPQHDPTAPAGPILRGLGPFGTRYATDFDIQPLPLNTFFHQSTFIGSGDFAASLQLAKRDLTVATGHLRVHVAGEVFEWGAWTADVATGLDRIPHAITEALQTLSEPLQVATRDEQLAVVTANVDHMLRSVVRYCSKCLTLLDPVPDRRAFLQHVQSFVENLLDVNFDLPFEAKVYRRLQIRCWQYVLVIVTQAALLSNERAVQAEPKQRCQALAVRAAQNLARCLLPCGFEELRAFYEHNGHAAKREGGIRQDDTAVSGIVLLKHCVSRLDTDQAPFWRLLEEAWQHSASNLESVLALDKV
ncbi:hypothetical protein LTR53_006869, partial [Teratosphaeriaceae sp. CCFEE 6253]